ncbi:Zn-dependent hydrolase [Kribbella yunnanensis]|uniref:Zn-dependent hydrolase n=1 Tax=Kribbella yunnanensis TaxID=190194 RepID=A0ABP4UYL7_9ACTN
MKSVIPVQLSNRLSNGYLIIYSFVWDTKSSSPADRENAVKDLPLNPSADRLATDLVELSALSDRDQPGWSREVFGEPYREARTWVARRMQDAGLEVSSDGAGNIVGILAGNSPGAPPLVTGSHTDTVAGGGRFDGVVGVLGAIELARCLRESGTKWTRDLVVVDFLGEESNDWGLSCLGSRAVAGELSAADLSRVDRAGVLLGDRYQQFDLSVDSVLSADWLRERRPHAYVELHIEQGPLLERRRAQIGVVTAIAGIQRLVATFTGRPDHAGTRPMDDRRDAMVAAARAVLAVQQLGCGAPTHGVTTVTNLDAGTASPNVVPASVQMKMEMRSIDRSWFSAAQQQLVGDIAEQAAREDVDVDFIWTNDNEILDTTLAVQNAISGAAENAGRSWVAVPSGATHDAVHIAGICPTGMIFVPSKDGRSHCPEEWSDVEDIAAGVEVLGRTLAQLDRAEKVT